MLLRVDHVGIAVPDLDVAIAWYAATFGLASVHEEVNEEQGVRSWSNWCNPPTAPTEDDGR